MDQGSENHKNGRLLFSSLASLTWTHSTPKKKKKKKNCTRVSLRHDNITAFFHRNCSVYGVTVANLKLSAADADIYDNGGNLLSKQLSAVWQ